MQQQLDHIEKAALEALHTVEDQLGLEQWRVTHLGRSSALMQVFDKLGSLLKEDRPVIGKRANQVKGMLKSALSEKDEALRQASLAHSLHHELLDVSLPGRPAPRGRLHPTTQTLRLIYRIFADMGFQVYRSRGGNR